MFGFTHSGADKRQLALAIDVTTDKICARLLAARERPIEDPADQPFIKISIGEGKDDGQWPRAHRR
jgi:hypothetical protein